MPKFRKKPVVIEARRCVEHMEQYGGYTPEQLADWCGGTVERSQVTSKMAIDIPTLEGTMRAEYGDWIIKGVKGEFYPCKPDIFAATYEPVPERIGTGRSQGDADCA